MKSSYRCKATEKVLQTSCVLHHKQRATKMRNLYVQLSLVFLLINKKKNALLFNSLILWAPV